MNKKCMSRYSIVLLYIVSLATFVFSCSDSRDAKIRAEITQIEGQIRNIDQQVVQLIEMKEPRMNIGHTHSGNVIAHAYKDKFLNDDIDSKNNKIEAEIYKLKSQREVLFTKLNTLYQSLSK